MEPVQLESSLLSLSEKETRLPCHYRMSEEEKLVQVSWYKELPDGSKEQIVTAHFLDGQPGGLGTKSPSEASL